jgi:hypothetical protein
VVRRISAHDLHCEATGEHPRLGPATPDVTTRTHIIFSYLVRNNNFFLKQY